MSQLANLQFAQQFLKLLAEQAPPGEIALLFSPNVQFEIPGDDNVLPWIGRRTGRRAIMDFITDLRTLTEPVKFDVRDVLASESRAVILADFATRIRASGQVIVSSTAIILEVTDGVATRFLMIEDSFEVSRKVRGKD